MKIYNETIMMLPKARHIVKQDGSVAQIGFVLNSYSTLKMLNQRMQHNAIRLMWQRSLAKQNG